MKKIQSTNSAEELLKEEAGEIRHLRKHEEYLIVFIGVAWALFQLSLPSFLILNSTKVRAIHLAFALAMLYLNVPLIRRPTKYFQFLSAKDRIPLIDYTLAITGVLSALYIVFDWDGLVMRAGTPITRDIVIGIILIVSLLEATRRSIGKFLTLIVVFFTIYAFTGPYLPYLFAYKGVSLYKYMNQIALSTEGIYGIPLGVSASIVYLFVLLGAMLDKAGAGKFFIDLAVSLLGKYKGGPAKAAVLSSGLTGLISGSSIANVVTTGTFTIPLMKSSGYPAKKAAAVEVAASTNGQLMPPIMGAAAFIIAEYVNVPYLTVIKAAAIPALAAYFTLFYLTHLEAGKLGLKGLSRENIPNFKKTLLNGIHFLIPILLLMYELVALRHSPELAAYRAILILIVIIFYQEIRKDYKKNQKINPIIILKNSFSIIGDGFVRGSRNMMSVALATASAGIIVGIVNMGIGGMLNQIVEVLSYGNIFLLLIITAVVSLILGLGLPTTANYIVMASLTAPLIVVVGASYDFIVPLMAAHLFCFFFGILADDTPPVGLAAYAGAAIADADPIATGLQGFFYDIRTAILPFMFIFNPDIILHNINNWFLALLIFTMTTIASLSFAAVLQGWLLIKTKWFEAVVLLISSLILFNPAIVRNLVPLEDISKYYFYPIGLLLILIAYTSQKMRMEKINE